MTEFFVGVFPGDRKSKRREAALNSVKELQDTLGRLNDIAVRKEALASKDDSLSAHAAAMLDAEEAKTDKLLDQAQAAHADFSAVKGFWKS
jgi:CHAD domain-containing protein